MKANTTMLFSNITAQFERIFYGRKNRSTVIYIALIHIYIWIWLKAAFRNIFKRDNRARRSELSEVEITGIRLFRDFSNLAIRIYASLASPEGFCKKRRIPNVDN